MPATKPVEVSQLLSRLTRAKTDAEKAEIQQRLCDPSLDRASLRGLLRRRIQVQKRSKPWGARAWLLATLGRVVEEDATARSLVEKSLDPKYEPEMWVRHWTLEGVRASGDEKWTKPLDQARSDPESFVSLLARAIDAERGDTNAAEELRKVLESGDEPMQWAALRALRIVPMPQLRDRVQSIYDDGTNKDLLWNARKALDRMGPAPQTAPQKQSETDAVPRSRGPAEETPDEAPETDALEEAPGPRIWLAAITDPQAQLWSGAIIGFTQSRGRATMENMGRAFDGDHVLLLQAAGEPPELVATGLVKGTSTVRGSQIGLTIEVVEPFVAVPLPAVQDATPGLPFFSRPDAFSPVEPQEWAVIREVIRHHAALTTPLELEGIEIELMLQAAWQEVRLEPQTPAPGDTLRITVDLRNTGNVTWEQGENFSLEAEEILIGSKRSDHLAILGPAGHTLSSEVLPGGTVELEGPVVVAADSPGPYRFRLTLENYTRRETWKTLETTVDIKVEAGDARGSEEPQQEQAVISKIIAEQDVAGEAPPREPIGEVVAGPEEQADEPQPSPPSRQAPAEVRVIRELYRPPASPNRLVIEVLETKVQLEFGGQAYHSAFTLGPARLDEVRLQPEAYGMRLCKAVINDNASDPPLRSAKFGFETAMEQTRGEMIVELRVGAANLRPVCWERLKAPRHLTPLATNERLPFYRWVASGDFPPLRPPLKVLIAICNPPGLAKLAAALNTELPELDVAKERLILEQGLERLGQAGLAEYEILGRDRGEPVTLERLTERLQEGAHIVHLLAHGLFLPDKKKYGVAIQSEHEELPIVSAEDLAKSMVTGNVRLAILEACQSGTVTQEGTALATILVEQGIAAVISMQEKLGVPSAQIFNQRFYHHLARSGRVDMALAATRFDLYQRKPDVSGSWSVPVLHLGSKSGKLFEVDEGRAAKFEDEEPRIRTPEELSTPAEDTERIASAIREASGGGALDEDRVRTIAESLRGTLAPAAERTETLRLPPRQNRTSLEQWMRERIDLDPSRLAEDIFSETRLEFDPSVYEQIASSLNCGQHIVLIGPPGTGKTTLAHAVSDYAMRRRFCCGTVPTTASADWTTFDTVGGYVPASENRLVFRPGIFLRALRTGHWLVIDEINRAEIDKAVGELFTVLSGQRVDLPYRVEGQPVRILPSKSDRPRDWVPADATGDYDYVVHPNWRTLATMNVYDRSSLFAISFAFMRRFAFIDIDVPDENRIFRNLRNGWVDDHAAKFEGAFHDSERASREITGFKEKLTALFNGDSDLMKYRELGPAIAKSMIAFAADRARHVKDVGLDELLGDAFLLYAVPQLDGLTRDTIRRLYSSLSGIFSDTARARKAIRHRIRALYPQIPIEDWPKPEDGTEVAEEGGAGGDG